MLDLFETANDKWLAIKSLLLEIVDSVCPCSTFRLKKKKYCSLDGLRIVVFDEKNKTIDRSTTNKMLTDARIHTLTVAWLLDSLACYKLFEFESYALYG